MRRRVTPVLRVGPDRLGEDHREPQGQRDREADQDEGDREASVGVGLGAVRQRGGLGGLAVARQVLLIAELLVVRGDARQVPGLRLVGAGPRRVDGRTGGEPKPAGTRPRAPAAR